MPSKPIKIAIVGTHFIGKSTLCNNLLEYLNSEGFNAGLIEEVVRHCPYPVNEMATLKAQDWILKEQKRREEELEKKHDVIVMDRGVIDNFAYWMRVADIINLDQEKIEEREKEVFEHSKSYDMLIFLQPFDSNKIKNDDFRSINPEWFPRS
jgi:nicotinamide riboside kinase